MSIIEIEQDEASETETDGQLIWERQTRGRARKDTPAKRAFLELLDQIKRASGSQPSGFGARVIGPLAPGEGTKEKVKAERWIVEEFGEDAAGEWNIFSKTVDGDGAMYVCAEYLGE